jgi:hypothetical protein
MTRRSFRAPQYSGRHLPAPPGLVVATRPRLTRRSAYFSPSVMNTGKLESAANNSGKR